MSEPPEGGQSASDAPALPAHRRRGVPTIGDVAALAGVSIGTVSKSLNGRQGVSNQTRSKVQEAAEALGFHSNALAQSLLTGRSFTVGLITNDSFGRFSIPVMLGAEDALQTGQIAVLLCDGRDDPIREQHYVRTLLARRVDGIIVTGRRTDPRPPLSAGFPVPIVYAMSESANPEDASVLPDDEGGGRLAVEYLIATGRTRIGHVTGPANFRAARLRAAGATGGAGGGGAGDGWGRSSPRRLERGVGAAGRVDHVAPSARRRRDLLRERPDRPRGERGVEGTGPKGARRHRARRFRQLDGHC